MSFPDGWPAPPIMKISQIPEPRLTSLEEFELTTWLTVDGIEVKRWWTRMPDLKQFIRVFDRDCGVLLDRAAGLPKERYAFDPDHVPEIELTIWFEQHGVKLTDTLETIDPETGRAFIRATFEAWAKVNGS